MGSGNLRWTWVTEIKLRHGKIIKERRKKFEKCFEKPFVM